MGTPDFAVPTLRALLGSTHEVVGAFSQPDRPKGRGYKLVPPPVKELALSHGVPVYQPVKMRDGTALEILKKLKPDVIVVAAYGRILPKEILELPAYGCINVHASLLPRYRGAGPVQWSVINGEKITGVTTMFMGEGLDTGDILEQTQTAIGSEETAGELMDRLADLGAQLLLHTLTLLESGKAVRTVQDEALATYAPMLQKSDGELDFSQPAQKLHDRIRGVSPWAVRIQLFGRKADKSTQIGAAAGPVRGIRRDSRGKTTDCRLRRGLAGAFGSAAGGRKTDVRTGFFAGAPPWHGEKIYILPIRMT